MVAAYGEGWGFSGPQVAGGQDGAAVAGVVEGVSEGSLGRERDEDEDEDEARSW